MSDSQLVKRWRPRELLAEALANVSSAPVRSSLVLAAMALLTGGIVFGELAASADILELQRNLQERGASVFVLSDEAGAISSLECVALSKLAWIETSGSVGPLLETEFRDSPGTIFRQVSITGGMLPIWGADPDIERPMPGVILGESAATELGVTRGMWLASRPARVDPVALVLDPSIRYDVASRWVTNLQPPLFEAQSCWIEVRPEVRAWASAALRTALTDTGTRNTVRPLAHFDELTRDPSAELASRPLADAWLAGGFIVTLVGWLSAWFRRREFALYRALGTDRWDLWNLAAAESWVLLSVGLLLGFLTASAAFQAVRVEPIHIHQLALALKTAVSLFCLAVMLIPAGAVGVGRDTIADQLKDR